jgi:hypothetical protein
MKCEEFEVHLNEILDERRRPEWDEQLRLHGEGCRGCRDLAAAYGVLFEGFFALPAPQAPADLSARVLEQLQARPLVSPRLAVLGAIFSTAAAVLVAALLMRGNGLLDRNAGDQVAQAPAAIAPLPTGDHPLHWDELSDVPFVGPWLAALNNPPGSDPYANLAEDTGQGLALIVLRMPRVAGPQGVRPPTPATGYGTSVWPLQVSEELRPVTESMTETFNLLLDALPLTFWSETRTRES